MDVFEVSVDVFLLRKNNRKFKRREMYNLTSIFFQNY